MNIDVLRNYSQTFEAFMANNSAPDWFQELQKKGLYRAVETGFPTRKNEEWRYTNITELTELKTRLSEPVTKLSKEEQGLIQGLKNKIVFINGRFSSEYSTIADEDGVEFGNLNDVVKSSPAIVEALFQDESSHDVFVDLNAAFVSEGICLTIAPETRLKDPLYLVYLECNRAKQDDDALAQFVSPHTFVSIGARSEATLVESYVSLSKKSCFTNAVTRVFVKEGAHLEYVKIQAESKKTYHLSETQIHLRRDAKIHHHCISKGARLARNNLKIILDGTGAHAEMNGLYTVCGSQTVDNHTVIDHKQPHTTSNQNYKGLLDDESHAVFNGKVIIQKDAQKVEAQQINRNLILSDKACVDTKPELQIAADDVSCTHGATVGQIDEEEVFYLESRGIPQKEARRLLIGGFVNELIGLIKDKNVRSLVGATLGLSVHG